MKKLLLLILFLFPAVMFAQYRISVYVVPQLPEYETLPNRSLVYDLETGCFYRVDTDFRTYVPIPEGECPTGMGGKIDSIFYFKYSTWVDDLSGWYGEGDTILVDTSLWDYQANQAGDFAEEDFGNDFLLFLQGLGIFNKSDEIVTITNDLYLEDTLHFGWHNPDAITGVVVHKDGMVDTVQLVDKAWLLWCDTLWVDSIYLKDPPYGWQAYELKYDPVSELVYYFENDEGGGGDTSHWYVDGEGLIHNKPSSGVYVDTALRLDNFKFMFMAYKDQMVLMWDSVSGYVHASPISEFIDSTAVDSSYWELRIPDTVTIKNDYKVYMTDSIYFNRYAIPSIKPGEPLSGEVLVARKLYPPLGLGQLARVPIDILIDTLQYYGVNYWTLYEGEPRDTLYNNVALAPGLIAFKSDVFTDRWIYSETNTAFGVGVLSGGTLSTAGGGDNGQRNTVIGGDALQNATLANNNAILGYSAMKVSTTASRNTSIGAGSLITNTIGSNNAAIGYAALGGNLEGHTNTALGSEALSSNYNNSASVAVGYQAMSLADNRATGRYTNNTAVGFQALKGGTPASGNTGINNTVVGFQAGYITTTGGGNSFIGSGTGDGNTTGYDNTVIGYNAMSTTQGDLYNNVAIGKDAFTFSGTYNSYGNTVVGYSAGQSCMNGSNSSYQSYNNTFLGTQSGAACANNTTSYIRSCIGIGNMALYRSGSSASKSPTYNIAIGEKAFAAKDASSYTDGDYNIAIGNWTLQYANGADRNIAIGDSAAYKQTTGDGNIFMGSRAGFGTTDNFLNIAIGNDVMYATASRVGSYGSQNTFIGHYMATDLTTGYGNVGMGYLALAEITTGHYNSAIGGWAMQLNTTGSYNTALGYFALIENINKGANTAIGAYSLRYHSDGAEEDTYNTAVGAYSAVGNVFNSSNTFKNTTAIGAYSLANIEEGQSNTAVGTFSAAGITWGDYNVSIGDSANFYNNADNNVVVGSRAMSRWEGDVAAAKTFDYGAINVTDDRITITAHGFAANNDDFFFVKFTEGTSSIPGLTNGTIYKCYRVTADYIDVQANITSQGTGTGHTFTPVKQLSNIVAVGYNAEPTKSNQIVLGNSTTIETLLYGCLLLTPQADPPSPASAGMIYSDTDGHLYHYDGSNWDQLDN